MHGLTIENGNLFAADWGNNRIEEFYAETGAYETSFGTTGAGENLEFNTPGDVAYCNGELCVTDVGNSRVQIIRLTDGHHEAPFIFAGQFGKPGKENGQFSTLSRISCNPAGTALYVSDKGNDRVQIFSPSGGFLGEIGSAGSEPGQFNTPIGVAVNATATYVVDNANNRIEKWTPGKTAAHTTRTVYYTTSANTTYPSCGNHPEWAGLACQAGPAAQPETPGLPNLLTTTYNSYNVWDEPLSVTDTSGATTRTTTRGYDAAGRPTTSTIASTADTPLAALKSEYNTATGALAKQTQEGRSQGISITENSLGQMTAYTDAEGATTTYEYEREKDYRLVKTSDAKGSSAYGYETSTGALSTLKDSAAGTFTATRDVEGNIISEGYPNGMSANYTLNALEEPTNLEYVKTTHCTSGCTLYSDAVTPSIRGQWLSQTSSLSKQSYAYNDLEQLTEVQDTPAGKGCTTRRSRQPGRPHR